MLTVNLKKKIIRIVSEKITKNLKKYTSGKLIVKQNFAIGSPFYCQYLVWVSNFISLLLRIRHHTRTHIYEYGIQFRRPEIGENKFEYSDTRFHQPNLT